MQEGEPETETRHPTSTMFLSDIVVRSLAVRGGGSLGQLIMQVKDPKGCLGCPSRRTLAR